MDGGGASAENFAEDEQLRRLLYNKAIGAIARIANNSFGWQTDRRILVIESDDWGSARLPNKEKFRNYASLNQKVSHCAYMQYDSLETTPDLERIGNVLSSISDFRGRQLCFSPNYIMANPDFPKIEQSDFQTFFYEPFDQTIARNCCDGKSLITVRSLCADGLWCPQFHGREHVNVSRWLTALRAGVPAIREAFDQEIYGVSRQCAPGLTSSVLEAYAVDNPQEIDDRTRSVAEGLQIFSEFFGFFSRSFIPPNYILAPQIHGRLHELGIEGLQGLPVMKRSGAGQWHSSVRIVGRHDRYGLVSMARNAVFEPSLNVQQNNVDIALAQIGRAFQNRSAAVLCSHRLNYMGGISIENQNRGLSGLRELMRRVQAAWPDVEFMSTDELLSEMQGESHA